MTWKLRDSLAILETPCVNVAASLAETAPTLRILPTGNSGSSKQLSVEINPMDDNAPLATEGFNLGEAYVRQQDLIAFYPQKLPWHFGYQLDFRRIPGEKSVPEWNEQEFLTIEVWLSVQTSLLDSNPKFEIRVSGGAFEENADGLWLDSENQSAILIHPLDREDCQSRFLKDSQSLEMSVFGRFMEKGVIRRMRFRILASPISRSKDFWIDRLNEFSESPLPLTT